MLKWAIIAFLIILPIFLSVIGWNKAIKKSLKVEIRTYMAFILIWLEVILVVLLFHSYKNIDLYQTIDLITTLTLVVVTAWYAFYTYTMSKTMKKQADAMEEQRLSAYKPFIILKYRGKTSADYFIKNFTIDFIHERGGVAIDLNLFVKSDIVEFKRFKEPGPIVEHAKRAYTFGIVNADIPANSIPPKYSFTLVAEYCDTSGNQWESTLKLFWDEVIKDIKVLNITVAKLKKIAREGENND